MMDEPWTVAHVDRPSGARNGVESATRLSDAFKLAEQLGGRTVVLTGDDIVHAVLDHAHRNNVTQIVIGKGKDSRVSQWLGRSLAAELLRKAEGVAIHIVTEGGPSEGEPSTPARTKRKTGWSGYALGAAYVGVVTLVAVALDRSFARVDLGIVYLSAVLAAGVFHGLRPALAAATAAFLVYNFLFLDPRYSFAIGSPTDVLTLVVFWAVALVTGWLAGRVKEQARAAQSRASTVSALLAASQTIAGSTNSDDVARLLAEQISAAATAETVILLPRGDELVPWRLNAPTSRPMRSRPRPCDAPTVSAPP
jgi:two-component system sensor histidine kinase KdpD